MHSRPDPVVQRQFPVIVKIVQDETWLEGERRGQAVSAHDPTVVENVCQVVLRVGGELRERFAATPVETPPLNDSC